MKHTRQSLFFIILLFISWQGYAKKIVVTGGAGFIGSHVAERLLERGDQVVIIDNLNDYYNPAIKQQNLWQVSRHDTQLLQVYKADITDKAMMDTIFEREHPDIICHLAAYAGVRPSIQNPELYIKTNIIGTLNMLEMARKYTIKHIVIASSSSVYGRHSSQPFDENESADKPSSPYGMTKRAAELLSYTYHELYDLSITNLRFFTVYGPRGRVDMAPFIFMDAIHNNKMITLFGDGTAIRDFTYISDIVDGVVNAIDRPLGYANINLGRGEPVILKDFINTIEHIVGKKAQINYEAPFDGDVPLTHADITKAKTLLGYYPKVSIEEGMRHMYKWYCESFLKNR